MMKKIVLYSVILLLLISVVYLKIKNDILSTQLKTSYAIHNYRSVTLRYVLDKRKISDLQVMLDEDIRQLVGNYDSEIFENNELLSHICSDLKYIKQILNDTDSQQKIKLIENDCMKHK